MTLANSALQMCVAVSASKAAGLPEVGGSVQVVDPLKLRHAHKMWMY
jgi:hypothetical protein